MKKLTSIILILVMLIACATVFAGGSDLTIDELSLDKSAYKIGETATITFEYNVPYDGDTSASAVFTTEGLKGINIKSARTLVCDDETCQMHNNVDFLTFSGTTLKLQKGYSGTVTFTATIENAANISIKCKLTHGSDSKTKSCSAIVTDYVAPTPAPTPKPTDKPKQTDKPKNTPKPTTKPTDKPKSESSSSLPHTGGASMIGIAVICLLGGGILLVSNKKQ